MNMTGIKDFLRYKSLSGLKASPSGARLVFDVMQPTLEENRYTRELWLLENEAARRLLPEKAYAGHFVWADDENGECAVDISGGCTQMATLNMAAGRVLGQWEIPAEITGLCYLGDGLYAYTAMVSLRQESHPVEIAFLDDMPEAWEIVDELPIWSDGKGFISQQRNRAYLFNKASGETLPLLQPGSTVDEMRVEDGKLYLKARTYQGMNVEAGLYCYNQATNTTQQLVPEGTWRIFDFAPCGGQVLFAAQNRAEQCMTDDPGFFAARDGGVHPLPIPACSVGNTVSSDCLYGETFTFACNADKLYFVHTGQHSSFLMQANPATGSVQTLTSEGGSIESFVVTPSGTFVVAMRGQSLQELYKLEESGALKQLTFINEEEPCEVVKPETFTFENHGYNVNYVVLPPANFNPAKQYPAILYIHGGAKVLYTDVFFHEMQFLASNGYFVLYGNPHGSEGQGSGFARLLGEYGQKDFDDITKAMDKALQLYPNIDSNRLGVAGGSYGGIMTNWSIGHTNRFRAAVAQRSICSMLSTFGTADNGYNFVREQMDGDLWDGFGKLWEQSPLKYANLCQTPLLLIHSTQDYRCHYTEAVQMFTALKYHGVETRLCLIDGECHSLSRTGRPKQRIKRLYEIQRWFDLHLKDEQHD